MIAGFCFMGKTPKNALIFNKKVSNSVSTSKAKILLTEFAVKY